MKRKKDKENFIENPREIANTVENVKEEEKPEEIPVEENSSIQHFVNPATSKKDDMYANFSEDDKSYLLEPSFKDAFVKDGIGKTGSSTGLLAPSVNDYWKPLLPSGVETSYINGKHSSDIEKKLDILFAKLDDLQNGSVENAHLEITMFISMGLMVMFMMDVLVKYSMK